MKKIMFVFMICSVFVGRVYAIQECVAFDASVDCGTLFAEQGVADFVVGCTNANGQDFELVGVGVVSPANVLSADVIPMQYATTRVQSCYCKILEPFETQWVVGTMPGYGIGTSNLIALCAQVCADGITEAGEFASISYPNLKTDLFSNIK